MRRAQRIALLATALVVALPAGVAHADWQTDRAQQIAAKVWNDPCGGKVTLWYTTPPDPDWLAWAYPQLCTLGVSTTYKWRWNRICSVFIHEYGHLAGYKDPTNTADPDHSRDPDDVMYAFAHDDARCEDYGSAFLGVPRPAEAPTGGVGGAVSVKRRARARRAGAAGSARGSAGRSRAKGRAARRSRAR